MRLNKILFLSAVILFATSCRKDEVPGPPVIPFVTTPYELERPTGFPQFNTPDDNQLTQEGVALGRRLFYDKMLSGNFTQSC